MTSENKVEGQDEPVKLELKHGERTFDSAMLGGMLVSRWLDGIYERRLLERMKTPPAQMQQLAPWMLGMIDEPVPGKVNTWRRVPREFLDVFEPLARAHAEPSGGVTFRVSAELVQLVSPTPEPARSAGWITFDPLAPDTCRIEVSSRRRGKSTRHRDGL